MNNHEATEDAKDYFEDHFCIPVCRQGKVSNPTDPRLVTKANNCDGCFFENVTANRVNKDMDRIIQVAQLADILEVGHDG